MAAQISGAGEGRGVRGPRKLSRRTVLTVAAAAVVLTGGALAVSHFTTSSSTGGRVVVGNTVRYTPGHQPLVPDFTATSLTGTPIKISDYRGKVQVLSSWGSWCAPCRAEAPTLEVAYEHRPGTSSASSSDGSASATWPRSCSRRRQPDCSGTRPVHTTQLATAVVDVHDP